MKRGTLLMPAPTNPVEREAWLAARMDGIGASEIAVVLGISPYDSPFSLYWRKKLRSHIEANEDMEWGSRLEDAIAVKFAENHPDLFLGDGGLYQHADHSWMLATPDRLAYNHLCLRTLDPDPATWGPCGSCWASVLVQLKTTFSFDGWGEPGTDQIPDHYRAQVMQEMEVYGAARCWIPVLSQGKRYREYVVDYDAADAALLVKRGAEFMDQLSNDEPPRIDGSVATTQTLKQLHPDVIDDCVTVPQALADRWWQAKQILADAEAAHAEVTNQMRAAVGKHRYGVAGGRRVAARVVYDSSRVAGKRLKKDHPDLYEQYTTTSTTDKLTPIEETP